MPTRPGRRFTVMDSMVLVAATAVGLSLTYGGWDWNLWYWQSNCPVRFINALQKPLSFTEKVAIGVAEAKDLVFEHGIPMLVSWTGALLVLQLRSPRPGLRRLARRPGFVAVLIPVLVITARSICLGLSVLWYCSHGKSWQNMVGGQDFEAVQYIVLMLGSLSGAGTAVGSVWFCLVLGGRWKAERSWVDRVGRVIGVCWMSIALFYYMGIDWFLFSVG